MSEADSKKKTIIGIDLGTTYSCLACWDDKTQQVQVIPSPSSGRTMASWVSFLPSGKLVGDAAKAQASQNTSDTIYDVKRILGRSFHDEVVQTEVKRLNYKVKQDDNGNMKICVNNFHKSELAPEEVSAMILAELKAAAEAHLDTTITDAVITVPAHFNNQQRQATKDAGRIAGLNVRRIINEPTAAALAYGLHGSNDAVNSNVVIFDLGGGTFDVTVLTMNGGVFEVKATGGDTHLGGQDFDAAMVQHCLETMDAANAKKVANSPKAMARLRRAVETAKQALSTTSSSLLEIDSLVEDFDLSMTITRETFEEVNKELFQKCLETVREVLVEAKVELAEVSDVVLVGGSTRVPILQQQLHQLFEGRLELSKSVHPDEAVAIGAAVQGHILATGGTGGGMDLSTTDLLLLDVTPLSLGIELEGKQMSTLIKRNTAIPCSKTRTYTTVADYQTSIDVVVYEGERSHVDANHKLGSFVISGIQRAKAGEPQVDVTFALDANGILNVTARDQVTEAEAKAQIQADRDGGRLSEKEIDAMVADAEKFRAMDGQLAQKALYRNALETALFEAQDKAVGPDEVNELAELMDWLELDSETATLEDMKGRGRVLEDKYGIIVSTSK